LSILACTLAALLIGTTPGVKYMNTVVQDDAVFLHAPFAEVDRAAKQVKALGADYLRVTAGWSVIAPQPKAVTRPAAPFDAADPATYGDGFRRLDKAVLAAANAGLKVEIDIGFWAPRWAVARAGHAVDRQRYKPDPTQFAAFAAAVARRYSGAYGDPLHPGHNLPAVRMLIPWNEPNHPAFLLPQWQHTASGQDRPVSADIYRSMYLAAHDAIKAVAPADQVLLGNLASTTSDAVGHGGVAPLRFLREMACVDEKLAPLQTPECANYRPLPADGIALHPYSNHFGSPASTSPQPDDVPLADTDRLTALIGALKAHGRITSWWPLYDTEYGYETSPPDPFQTTTPMQQAQYLSQASFLAWQDPNTRMFAQFELRDVDPRTGRRAAAAAGSKAYWADYQSGLYYDDGRAKPAATAFQLPFWAEHLVRGDDQGVLLWGMVRPGRGRRVVRFERQDPASGKWYPIHTLGLVCLPRQPELLTDGAGVITSFTAWSGPATYRMSWLRSDDDTWVPGAPIAVDAPTPVAAGGRLQTRSP
jgi:hypothetical protein